MLDSGSQGTDDDVNAMHAVTRINVVELLAEKGEKVKAILCYVICCLTINEFRFLRKLIVLASRSNFPKTLFLVAYVFMVTFTGIPVL